MKGQTQMHDHCSHHDKGHWYTNKIFLVTIVLGTLISLSFIFSALVPFRQSLSMYVQVIWWAVLLGLILGGAMEHFIPREYISHILAQPYKKTILHAVVMGFFMSVCSHGILALAIQLHKKGASTPSVIAFLLASPWANLPLTILLFGFFGLARTIFIILAAIVIAVSTGFIYQILESKGLVEKNKNSLQVMESFSIAADIKERFRRYRFTFEQLQNEIRGVYRGAVSLSNMVLWWILIGVGLASLAGAYISEDIFQQYMGPTMMGMFMTLIVATIMEVCSEGTAPMAFEIFRQTGALGNSFVFLMAGVATDYTEIGLLWHNVGKKAALWLPLIAVPQIILLGIIANFIF